MERHTHIGGRVAVTRQGAGGRPEALDKSENAVAQRGNLIPQDNRRWLLNCATFEIGEFRSAGVRYFG